MAQYRKKKPTIVEAVQVTNETYDGFSDICAYALESLLFIDERLYEKEYMTDDSACRTPRCEYEDDGYCMKLTRDVCPHMRKIGYIKGKDDFVYHYPLVGDYMIIDESGKVSFMTAEKFEETFELVK